MDLSRGFHRLSIVVALIGLAVLLVLGLGPEGHLATASLSLWVWLIFLFAGLPAIFVLLLGWVIAGFRKSN